MTTSRTQTPVIPPKPARRALRLPFLHLKIRGKLALGFGLQLALVALVAAVGLLGLRTVQNSFRSANERGEVVERLAAEMKTELLEARRAENDFLLRWQTEGFLTAQTNYVTAHQTHIGRIREIIAELETAEAAGGPIATGQRIKDDLTALTPYVNVYSEDFLAVVALIEQRGFKDTGLEGQFRVAAHAIEDRINDHPGLESLTITLLQIRHREQDYLLLGESQYVTNVHDLAAALQEQIAASNVLTEAEKAELAGLTDTYVATFGQLVAIDTQLATKIEAVRSEAIVVEPLVTDIALSGEQDAIAEIAAAQSAARQTTLIVSVSLVVTILTGMGLAYVLNRQITNPLQNLARTAEAIGAGDLTAQAQVVSQDEIGTLAATFNGMTSQIRTLVSTLEQRVADRTRALATSTEVSRLSTILNQDELVREVVEQVKNAFDYYHVHIYLWDERHENLVMAGGTGEAGRIMLASGHSIPAERGLVGRAAETGTVVLVPDVSQTIGWLPNPLLPDTKAEIAVPVLVGDNVLGVLDVQHYIVNGLDQNDADLLQSIANQVAIALQNARAYAAAQQEVGREARRSEIVQKIQSTTSIEEAMKVAIRELGRALGAQEMRVRLKAEGNDYES